MSEIIFSCIIPARDKNDPLLQDLIKSIKAQDFPQDKIEIIVVTEGDSEQAKGIGIRRAKGEICAMFCCDNVITEKNLFSWVKNAFANTTVNAIYPRRYAHVKTDNSLNRYFSLIGGNDPVCYYLGKNDRWPHNNKLRLRGSYPLSYGCNGFFYRSKKIKATDLDHYYPMDNAMEVGELMYPLDSSGIWHRTTDGNLFTFLKKRYIYARDLYCDRTDRRWRMVDGRGDVYGVIKFCIYTILVIPCLSVSFTLFKSTRDKAAFWHWPVCLGFLITYGLLACRNLFVHQSLFQAPEKKVSENV